MRSILLYFLILPFIGISVSCSKNHNVIEGTVQGIGNTKVELHAFDGMDLILLDSVSSKNDVFTFTLPEDAKHGMYHLRWGSHPAEGVDIVYTNTDIHFTTKKDSIHLIVFDNSPENELFFAFYPIRLTIQQLANMGDEMNRADPIGNKPKLIQLNHYIDSVEFSVNELLENMDAETKQMFAWKIIRAAFYPNYDYELAKGKISKQDPFVFMQTNFFKYVDFNEPGLIRTPFIHQIIEEYLLFFIHPSAEEQYKKACDLIISKAAVNDEMYEYVVNLLVRTFEKSDFLDLYLYLMETYMPEKCHDDENYANKDTMYEIIKNSSPGSKANDIKGLTPEGNPLNLYTAVSGKAIVLLFWDPDCEYCKMVIQQLVTVWPAYREMGLEVITFGLTKSKDEWLSTIQEHQMENFINISDFRDTESDVFNQYHIRGTPEIYVLTNDFVIFSRPSNYMQLDKDLMKILNQ